MSKNVAVFVDVANIFYAAKAAGVDIDYVTLLKSATAGRDFVRAYAYTGLDPENENQRQFHAFLARSGYKVVSKDIRKYGDGRIKANLDIELVVDMMRMAEKLDVAVVVSGDGDFAPAISAVQQHGVRVEVISFRGNTSSDLIDVADVFIDIASVAKVEKGARSGRRVAAEGDLSMTEVPDKESGVTPRQRRRDGDDRPERAERPSRRRGSQAAPVASMERVAGSALVALPGEKLSRGGGPAEMPEQGASDHDTALDEGDEPGSEDGRRRRRRRGGRGRGRGGRGPEETEVIGVSEQGEARPAEPEPQPEAEANEFPDEVPTLPQHSGFGSVWDRQIGPPPERRPGTSARPPQEASLVDDLESEPDVPEYLLAEKRQHDRR
ncbi:MAG: NYN domain-containing protein, partial [Candidatus Limnocylindrales bacterium]